MRVCVLGLAAMSVVATGPARAQQPDPETVAAAEANADYLDRTPVRCVTLPRVRDTEVIDDRTILFSLRGGDHYLNVMDQTCFGLESSRRFILESRTSRLCSSDLIQPFRQFGSTIAPGIFCRIGEFHPLTQAEADMLEMDADELAAARRSVVLTPLEVERVEDGADVESPGDAGALSPAAVPASPPPDPASEETGP